MTQSDVMMTAPWEIALRVRQRAGVTKQKSLLE